MRNDCTQQCLVLIRNLVLLFHHVPFFFFVFSPLAFCSNCRNPLFLSRTSFAYLKRRLIRRHFCNFLFFSPFCFILFHFFSPLLLLQLISDRHLNRFLPISISGPCLPVQTKDSVTKEIKTIRSAVDCVIVYVVLTNMFLFPLLFSECTVVFLFKVLVMITSCKIVQWEYL